MNFKKNILSILAPVSLAAMVGCSDTDDLYLDVAKENGISFNTYASSRATEIDDEVLKEYGFGVYGYYTQKAEYDASSSKPNLMFNQHVEWSELNNAWCYSPLKYWGNVGDNHTFIGYAPYTDGTSSCIVLPSEVNGDPIIEYHMPENVVEQVDLTYYGGIVNFKHNGSPNPLKMYFRHALAGIIFSAKTASDFGPGTDVYIDKITVSFDSPSYPYTSGRFNIRTGKWDFTDAEHKADWKCVLTEDNFTSTKVTAEKQMLTNKDSRLLILPLPEGVYRLKTVTTVEYRVRTLDDKLPDGYSETSYQTTINTNEAISQGVCLTYNLVIKPNVVDFDSEPVEWTYAYGDYR